VDAAVAVVRVDLAVVVQEPVALVVVQVADNVVAQDQVVQAEAVAPSPGWWQISPALAPGLYKIFREAGCRSASLFHK
jgi:hypothetical protein